MRLLNDLYHITAREQHDEVANFEVALHADHAIYQAHFPGQPVTPGVVILQIAEELAGEMLGRTMSIASVKNVKFLSVLSPVETPTATFHLKVKSQTADRVALQVAVEAGDHAIAQVSFSLYG